MDIESKDVSDNGKIMILPFIRQKEAYEIIGKLVEMKFNKSKTLCRGMDFIVTFYTKYYRFNFS